MAVEARVKQSVCVKMYTLGGFHFVSPARKVGAVQANHQPDLHNCG